jgi:hypothetical protein
MVYSMQLQGKRGSPYPIVRYHWAKEAVIVRNPDEDAALGGGWADTPAAFEAYRGPRPARAAPDLADRLLEIPFRYHLAAAQRLVALGVDMIWTGDDVGGQHGMLTAPRTWRRFLKPRMAKFIASLKSRRAQRRRPRRAAEHVRQAGVLPEPPHAASNADDGMRRIRGARGEYVPRYGTKRCDGCDRTPMRCTLSLPGHRPNLGRSLPIGGPCSLFG